MACRLGEVSVGEQALVKILPEDARSLPPTELGSDSWASDVDSINSESDCDSNAEEMFGVDATLIVFDWDDTLLPSTWLRAQGLELRDDRILSAKQEEKLQSLARHAEQTLRAARCLGEVVLITNAEQGWVELSCAQFLPSLLPALQGLRVISARSIYEPQGVSLPSSWKRLAFETEVSSFCRRSTGGLRNVVSIGDSSDERQALIGATEDFSECSVKCIKFAERPEINQLLQQHEVIGDCLQHIVQYDGNLDMCIE